eukprot:s1893_g6.t1
MASQGYAGIGWLSVAGDIVRVRIWYGSRCDTSGRREEEEYVEVLLDEEPGEATATVDGSTGEVTDQLRGPRLKPTPKQRPRRSQGAEADGPLASTSKPNTGFSESSEPAGQTGRTLEQRPSKRLQNRSITGRVNGAGGDTRPRPVSRVTVVEMLLVLGLGVWGRWLVL